MELGKSMKKEFLLDESITYTNHGSYGPTTKSVIAERIRLIYEQENQPDTWFRVNLERYYDRAVEAAANFLGAKKENIVLVDNVTAGTNTVLKCLKFAPGEQILYSSHQYGAVVNNIHELKDFHGVEKILIKIPIPIKSEDEIVELYRKAFKENPNIKIAVIDHITSCSAIIIPVKKLIALCKEYGKLSLIDGAHAPGQLELNMEEMGADFYSGNFHKWCYVARSCGFLWIDPKHQSWIRPLVTSHGYKGTLSEQFSGLGTRDISNHLTVPSALKFYKDMGGRKALTSHADELLTFAQDLFCKELGTEKLNIPKEMRAPYMAVVRFPIKKDDADMEKADLMTIELFEKYKVQVIFTAFNETTWVRVSANIYNTKEDYVAVKDALKKYVDDINKRGKVYIEDIGVEP